MKFKYIFLVVLGLLNITKLCAQKCVQNSSPKILSIDFNDPKSFSLDCVKSLKKGDIYQVEVKNINLNLYSVVLGKKDSIIPSDVKFPTFEMIGVDVIKSISEGINVATFSTSTTDLSDFLANAKTSNGLTLDKNFLSDKALKNNFEINKLASLLESEWKQDYYNLITKINANSKIEKVKKEIVTTQQTAKNILSSSENAIKTTDNLLFELNLQALSYLEGLKMSNKNGLFSDRINRTLKDVIIESDLLREKISNIRKQLDKLEDDYKQFKQSDAEYGKIFEDVEIKKQDGILLGDISKGKETIDKILEKISQSKISEYLTSIIHLENNKDRTYVSMPIQHNGDISDLNITLLPKKPEYGQTYNLNYKFPYDNFYVGLSGSFYYANFKNRSFSIKETPTSDTTSNYSVINENDFRGEIGVAALLHIGSKISFSGIGLHGTIGPGLSISTKPLPRIAIGGGVSFGKRKGMLSLDLLCIAGNVNDKSRVFDDKSAILTAKPETVTVSKLSATFGISLGYIYKF